MKAGLRLRQLSKAMRSASLIALAAMVVGVTPASGSSRSTVATPETNLPPGSPSRGADLYEAKCGACHSLDANRIGPKHRGVFGRKAGAVPGFQYSPALKKLGVVWNAQTLDRWLQNPTAMAPGTAMGFRLSSAQERADVIAYLKQQSQHQTLRRDRSGNVCCLFVMTNRACPLNVALHGGGGRVQTPVVCSLTL